MAHTHNAILRGLNSIYLQSPYLNTTTTKAQDKSDFLFFTKTWASWVTHHHKIEEEILFPGFERVTGVPGLMARDVEQHHGFEGELQGFLKYVSEVGVEDVQGDEIRKRIEAFGESFRVHLEQEVEGLIGLGVYEAVQGELVGVYRVCEREATRQDKVCIQHTYPFLLVLLSQDLTLDSGQSPRWSSASVIPPQKEARLGLGSHR